MKTAARTRRSPWDWFDISKIIAFTELMIMTLLTRCNVSWRNNWWRTLMVELSSRVDKSNLTDEEHRVVTAAYMGLVQGRVRDLGEGKCTVEYYIGKDEVSSVVMRLLIKGISTPGLLGPGVMFTINKD